MRVREVVRLLEADGWFLAATRGSHRQCKHAVKLGRVTVAGKHSDDLAPGTLASIFKQVAWKKEQAIRFHLDGLRADGLKTPEPSAIADYIDA